MCRTAGNNSHTKKQNGYRKGVDVAACSCLSIGKTEIAVNEKKYMERK